MNTSKSTEKVSLIMSCVISIVAVVCFVCMAFYFVELPYQEFSRTYSSSVSLASITNESVAAQRSEFVFYFIRRLVVWFAVFMVAGPATYHRVYRPVKKYITKYWRKVK